MAKITNIDEGPLTGDVVGVEKPLYITFVKPYTFEGETYEGIDLSGMEDLTARDLIIAQKDLERGGTHSVLPEMTMEYACIFAARASGKPVEFFQSMRPRDAIKVKAAVTNFLYGQE